MNIFYRCPQCPAIQQGVGLSADKWKELFNCGEPITVQGLQCGHVWPLSDAEVEEIRKQVAA